MAYKKTFKKTYKKKYNKSTLKNTVNNLIEKKFKGERKYISPDLVHTPSTLGSVTFIQPITQGVNVNQRTGLQVTEDHLTIRGHVSMDTGAVGTLCTVWVIRDTQQISGTAPLFSDIFDTAKPKDGLLNRAHAGRFKILKKWIFLQRTDTRLHHISCDIPIKNTIQFASASSTAIVKNGLYVVSVSDRSTLYPAVDLSVRLSYYDN